MPELTSTVRTVSTAGSCTISTLGRLASCRSGDCKAPTTCVRVRSAAAARVSGDRRSVGVVGLLAVAAASSVSGERKSVPSAAAATGTAIANAASAQASAPEPGPIRRRRTEPPAAPKPLEPFVDIDHSFSGTATDEGPMEEWRSPVELNDGRATDELRCSHWPCVQNSGRELATTDAPLRARRGASGEQVRLRGQCFADVAACPRSAARTHDPGLLEAEPHAATLACPGDAKEIIERLHRREP